LSKENKTQGKNNVLISFEINLKINENFVSILIENRHFVNHGENAYSCIPLAV